MCIYTLYCTNLNHKGINISEKYGLNERDELVDSEWYVFDIPKQKKDEILQPLYKLQIMKDDVI